MRASHTTATKKAKCLKYRNGKRCGRVGKILVTFQDHQGDHRYPVCQECADAVVASGGQVIERAKGYRVITGQFISTREYRKMS